MTGAAGAFVLTGMQLLAGTFAVMWVTMLLHRVIDRGHYRATTWVLVPLMAAVSLALPGVLRFVGLGLAAGAAAFLAAVYTKRPLLEGLTGGAASAAGVGALLGGSGGAIDLAHFANNVSGALLLGALTHAMVLGHWYLNQPRLPMGPLRWAVAVTLGALPLSLLFGIAVRARLLASNVPGGVLVFSAAGYWWTWSIVVILVVAFVTMVRATLKTRSTQSATGLLFVAMIPAIVAQFIMNLLVLGA